MQRIAPIDELLVTQFDPYHDDHGKFSSGSGGAGLKTARAPRPPRTSEGKVDIRGLAVSYARRNGIAYRGEHQEYAKVNEPRARELADHYEQAPHAPHNAEVASSYASFRRETLAQYDHLTAHGIKYEGYAGAKGKALAAEPYENSEAMLHDLHRNGHLRVLLTHAEHGEGGEFPPDHPMLEPSGRFDSKGRPLLMNDVFRAVHDTFGHGIGGYQFGPRGEENAYLSHRALFTPGAHMALTNETRAQNSWVNYGRHLRRPDGSIPKRGEQGYVLPQERRFAKQKATRLPPQFYAP